MKLRKDAGPAEDAGEAETTEQAAAYIVPASIPSRAVLTDGPPEMNFYGRTWTRGQPQPVTPEEWSAMCERGAKRLGFNLTEEN
ncbi:MAG: hypothetical protein HY847_01285 [Betaproteobacteria bacterium]|nr:hypothetical protein [Betaproteobacteria bacterium]